MRIDSHQHFWSYQSNPDHYSWITEEYAVLRNTFLPDQLVVELNNAKLDGCIAVQARELAIETDYLLQLASEHDFIKGVVGWQDLCADDVEVRLEPYIDNPLLKGFRMLIHDRVDADFADSKSHARGVGLLTEFGWTYDLLLRTIHLPSAIRLVDQYPNQPFVVDHIAKPKPDGADWQAWKKGIDQIANRPNVYCKLSGLVTEADWDDWQSPNYHRFLDHVLSVFGVERCMYGSDWPVCTCATDYQSVLGVIDHWARSLSAAEQDHIFGKSCEKFYGI